MMHSYPWAPKYYDGCRDFCSVILLIVETLKPHLNCFNIAFLGRLLDFLETSLCSILKTLQNFGDMNFPNFYNVLCL